MIHNLLYSADHIVHILIRQGIIQRNTHDFLIVGFRIGTKPRLVSQFFIVRMAIDRQIMHLRVDILRPKRVKKLPSVTGKPAQIQAQNVKMPGSIRFRYLLLDDDLRHIRKSFVILSGDFFSAFGKQRQFIQLAGDQRSLEIGHAVIVAQLHLFVIPARVRGMNHLFLLSCNAMGAQSL